MIDIFGDMTHTEQQEEITRLRADLAKANADRDAIAAEFARRTAERDAARKEVLKALKEMYTTAGLRRELLRRGWWEWYKEVRP